MFYQIALSFYFLGLKIAASFNPKAAQFVAGRKNIFNRLADIKWTNNTYWFHCASLGEFEQAKPIIEKLKQKEGNISILITFFSPSGYEIGKTYDLADYVFYLPMDSSKNAQRFIEIVQPKKAFFIKYEFWYYFLFELHQNKIPTFLISGVFRKNQAFFKWHGLFVRKMLHFFTFFFLQNERSSLLLKGLGHDNLMVTGDTRLDRVYENSLSPDAPTLIKKFVGNKKVIIIGSSWPKEEKIIAEFIKNSKKDFKFIIAPHNVNSKRIDEIEKLGIPNSIRYSQANYELIGNYESLIIDSIGILANTYQFSDIAIVGGGFSGALHNILEPASFGNVVLFGPKHEKFHEAEELMNAEAAYEINDFDDLTAIVNRLVLDDNLKKGQNNAREYVKNGRGATDLILNKLKTI